VARVWVLDSGTKGTGAEMVPLEKVLKKPGSKEERFLAPRKRTPQSAEPPESSEPPRFKVVDVMTRAVLGEGTDARETVALLENVRSVVDVRVYVWEPEAEQWGLLSYRDQKLLWGFRGHLRMNESDEAPE
jgi:hypothetical protein